MSSSHWGWVDGLKLNSVPEPARQRLEYLTSLTVLHQLSVEGAQAMWSVIETKQNKAARRRIREDMAAQAGSTPSLTTTLLESVFVLAATATGTWFIAAIGSGVWTTVILAQSRRQALARTLRPGETAAALGKTRLAEVEQYAQRLAKEDPRYVRWLKPLKAPAKKVGETSLSTLFEHFLHDNPNQTKPPRTPGEINAGNYFQRIKQMGDRSQDLLTQAITQLKDDLESGTSEEEREALAAVLLPRIEDPGILSPPPGLPDLSKTLDKMRKFAAGLLKNTSKDLPSRSKLENLAHETLAHPWLLVFLAIYLPAPAIINRKAYETSTNGVPVQKNDNQRVPYKVDGEWFPVRTDWADDEAIALAEAIMTTVKIPPTYQTTYWDEARKRISLPTKVFVPGEAKNMSHYAPFESWTPGIVPKSEIAIRDFAFVLLADTLLEIQGELVVTPLIRDLLKDTALWAANMQDWVLMRNACTRDGRAKLRELGFTSPK